MRTRVTELLGIKYPIIQAAMGPISVPRLVAAVSNAGGLGILASGRFGPGELREDIKAIREMTDKPFGVSITSGTPGYEELAQVMIAEEVPLISHGRGNPGWLIGTARGHGIKIMAVVGAVRHAIRAEQDGADIICVSGMEAGGHVSSVGTMVLLPLVASKVKLPVVGAGGFCDGRGLVAALSLGAEGIALGTRFAATQESAMPDNIKQLFVSASAEDTVVTTRITGKRLRVLRNRLADSLEEGRRLSWRQKTSASMETRRKLGVSWWRFIVGALRMKRDYEASLSELSNLAAGAMLVDKAFKEGDAENGAVIGGQVCGRIEDIPPAGEIVERIVNEACGILDPLGDMLLKW
ncbi:MAG: nitronate monooxygenase [Chloroflexi bacterium]|nr:nitronate monooxygenase [Chloroflexota bacterium]